MDQVVTLLQQSLITIALAVITAGCTIAVSYINKLKSKAEIQINEMSDEATRKLTQDALDKLSNLCETVVKSLEQEVASEIRKKLESGDSSVSRDDLTILKDIAVNTVKSQITDELSKILESTIADVDTYINDKISACLLDMKTKK